jgi:phosphopantothenoylcysteine decarboxylase/phosphopantothenate--cysteine ligase
MNNRMWLHPATQANLATLRSRGVAVIGPDDGAQACGEFGPGRLSEPPAIVAALAAGFAGQSAADLAAPAADLAGRRVLISAGPTFEDLDPVRFIGNRSSGKMGFAIAAAAARRGAEVVVIAGPVHLPTPEGVRRIDVRSAAQMRDAVLGALPADVYIGAAAIADYAPRTVSAQKIKKTREGGGETLTVELIRTPDVLAEVAVHPQRPHVVVGFAAETHDVEHYARGKLQRKKLDMIAANQVGREGCGFESDDNALTVIDAETAHALGPAAKTALADALLDLIRARF